MTVALACEVFGSGPPMVVLHGLFGSARNWQSMARRLADDYRVFTVDLRNHGASPWAPTMTYAEMADDLEMFCASREAAPAVLLGHSAGGKVAMTFALRHPELVEALIVVDIAPVTYAHSFAAELAAMQAVDFATVRRRAEVEAALAEHLDDRSLCRFLAQNVRSRGGRLAWKPNLDAIGAAMADLVGFPDEADIVGFPDRANRAYPGRVLFISGARSNYIDRPHHDAIFAHFPQAEFAVVADAGHRVHVDQPDAFLARVTGFLDSAYA
jgi:esterase